MYILQIDNVADFGAFDDADLLIDTSLDGIDAQNFSDELFPQPATHAAQPKSSPATSESGNDCLIPKEDAGSGQSEGAAQPHSSTQYDDEEAKRLARMQRNRENAHLSRQRKKQQMLELQQQTTQLRLQTTQLTGLVHQLVAENCILRRHLAEACTKAGSAVPVVPSIAATPAALAVLRQPRPVMPSMPFVAGRPPVGLPFVPPLPNTAAANAGAQPPVAGPTTTSNVQQQPLQAQAAAPPTTASGRPTRKRARTATGVSAAFLAMLSVFMFVGPFMPSTQTGIQSAGNTLPASLEALPSAAFHTGRSLQSIESDNTALVPITNGIPDSNEPIPLGGLVMAMNQTMEALLSDPDARKAETKAFERLQELASAAVLLDPPSEKGILDAQTAFPLLAGSLFKGSGLQTPQACTKVFEFDAESLPTSLRNRRHIEKFLMRSYGFKGRSLGNLPAPLDSDSKAIDTALISQTMDREEDAQLVIPGASDEPLLVSVLLPANESSSSDGSLEGATLSVIDKVYVVLLNPQNKFVTYSCGLAKPLLV